MDAGIKQFKDLEDVAGVGVPVTIQGEKYTLSPIRLAEHALIRQWIKGERLDTWDSYAASHSVSAEEAHKVRLSILSANISDTEMMAVFLNISGLHFLLFLSLRQAHEDMTLDQVEAWISDPKELDRLASAVQAISAFTEKEGDKDGEGEQGPRPTQSGKASSPD